MSTLDDNKAIVRRYREFHDSGNLDARLRRRCHIA